MSDKFNIFGKPHSVIGESSSDLILRCKGAVKIQWGNKFIDLIKDGKINANFDFIYKSDSIGVKDGIYIIDDKVILKAGDTQIDLTKESENTYISYLIEQKTSSEQKYQALKNIGFIYNSLDSITEDSLKNGIVYIESEQKLYIIKDGELTEYSIKIPNPYPEQFVIAKNDSKIGALIIEGSGVNNSLCINSAKIYSDNGDFVIDSGSRIIFKSYNSDIISIDQSETIINNNVVSNYFGSFNAASLNGFRLYMDGNESTLEVDNLIVRNNEDKLHPIYPSYWFQYQNIITSVNSLLDDGEYTKDIMQFNLKYSNRYSVDDIVHVFIDIEKEIESDESESNEDLIELSQSTIEYKVTKADKNSIEVKFVDTVTPNPIESIEAEELYTKLTGKTIFLHSTTKEDIYLSSSTNNGFTWYNSSDTLKYNTTGRLGDLYSLILLSTDEGNKVPITGNGVYGETGVFINAFYTDKYLLKEDDNSSRIASTEWVNRRDEILKEEMQQSIEDAIRSVNNPNLNLYFNDKIANVSTTKSWITSNDELKKIIDSAKEETQVISCKCGQMTIQKTGNIVHVVAWVAAITDDDNTSHRSFEFDVVPSTYDITGLSTYILFTRYPGYYLSKNKSGNTPVNFYYIGTNKQDPDETYQYLWNWDGTSWSLVDTYVEDTQQYIFIRSTNQSWYYIPSYRHSKNFPGGFICYVDQNGNTKEVGYGKDRYIQPNTSRDLNEVKKRLQIIKDNVSNPSVNIKPQQNSYTYLWYILKEDDILDPEKWVQLSSESTSSDLVLETSSNWGNCSTPSPNGYDLYLTDDSNTAISKNTGIPFVKGYGSLDNWKNRDWVESFIRYSLSQILQSNIKFYNNITGWNFYYQTGSFLGYGGIIHILFGAPIGPTSNNSSDSGYFPKMEVYQLSGQVNGYGYSSEFYFTQFKIGKLLKNIGMSQDINIGDKCVFNNFLYDVSFDKYYAKVVDFANNKEEIITG